MWSRSTDEQLGLIYIRFRAFSLSFLDSLCQRNMLHAVRPSYWGIGAIHYFISLYFFAVVCSLNCRNGQFLTLCRSYNQIKYSNALGVKAWPMHLLADIICQCCPITDISVSQGDRNNVKLLSRDVRSFHLRVEIKPDPILIILEASEGLGRQQVAQQCLLCYSR